MAQLQDKIDELTRRISELSAQQMHFGKQLLALMNELDLLKQQANDSIPVKETVPEKIVEYKETITAPNQRPVEPVHLSTPMPPRGPVAKRTTSFEEFIGKNLASKIGILVTIVGIFIGARYAIEHNMVSPVVRIVSGYAWGIAFIGIALWLKKKYEGYSAVLMGGGLCVLYFITFIAWSYYQLLPQLAAFGLMLLFTVAIIYMAVWYNQIIIAHLGQVGAYAIPFLLSNNTGQFASLFTYIAIINAGILVLSFYKYWKSLFYVAFVLTWLIFGVWFVFVFEYQNTQHFGLAAGFVSLFFVMFYITFLSYKLIRKEQYGLGDIFLLLSNAFVFYAIGYSLLEQHYAPSNLQGVFTVLNALIHFGVSLAIKKLKLADRALYYMVLGLVIVFMGIAVPVQFDGNWVTLLWIAEGVLLFAIGRTRNVQAYVTMAAILLLLGFGSQVQDWMNYSENSGHHYFFFNIVFITGLLVAGALGAVVWVNHHQKWNINRKENSVPQAFFDHAVPAMLLVTAYFVFFTDLHTYFVDLVDDLTIPRNSAVIHEVRDSGDSSLLLYSEVFLLLLVFVYKRWLRSQWLMLPVLIGTVLISIMLFTAILPASNDLMADYYLGRSAGYTNTWDVALRYLMLGAMAGLIVMGSQEIDQYALREPAVRKVWWLGVYVVILAAISYEYLNWASIAGSGNQYKVGLSIIWGLFALAMVIYGIWKKVKYIRLGAIVLFVITIIKLFLYDLSEAGTITKTISFISLGVILLLVSYLYNRYKDLLFGE